MKKNFVLYSMILLIMLMPAIVKSQVLSGTVSSEGKPLSGASVLVKGTTIGTSADANGFYTLKLTAGTYEVIFSFVGYTPQTITISLAINENRTLDVQLYPTPVTTFDVVVVGTRTYSRTVTDSPLPIDVLSYQELSNSGQTTFDKVLQHRVPSPMLSFLQMLITSLIYSRNGSLKH